MGLSERLHEVIECVTPATRRFVTLEEVTKIKSETWRTWWNRGGKASPDMIQEVARAWPSYALWLVAGITDELFGHIAPPSYTDNSGINMTRVYCAQEESRNYLKLKTELQAIVEAGTPPTEAHLWDLQALDRARWRQVKNNQLNDDEHPLNQSFGGAVLLRGKRIDSQT